MLTECQGQLPDEGRNEMSSKGDKIGLQARKQFTEFVCFSSETCECPSAQDTMWENAEHVGIGGIQVDRLFKTQRKVVPEILPPYPPSGPVRPAEK